MCKLIKVLAVFARYNSVFMNSRRFMWIMPLYCAEIQSIICISNKKDENANYDLHICEKECTLVLKPLNPGIVFEKVIVDYGGYKKSYLFMNESPNKRTAE